MKNYQLATIENELLEATVDDAGAFVDAATLSRDTAIRNITNDLAGDLYRSGTGTRGQIGSSVLNGVTNAMSVTLSNRSDVTQFETQMVLVNTTTDGGAPAADTFTITAINRSTGVLSGVSSLTPASGGTFSANKFLVVQGDIPTGGTTTQNSKLKLCGLAGWLPKVAPAPGENFWNVDRSVDTQRLAGVSFDGSGESIEEALIDAGVLCAEAGGEPNMCFINMTSYGNLEKSLGSKVQYVDVTHEEADIAFAGIRIHAPYGPITVH